MITTTKAATVLGVGIRQVQRYIESGQLKAERYGRDFLITQEELHRFTQQKRRRAGRPKKEKTR